jgi:hypothetical protein
LAAPEVTRTVALVRALGARLSPGRHRRPAPVVAGVAVAAMLGVWPLPAPAQTPPTPAPQTPPPTAIAANSASDLLQPTLQGNPTTPPRFRKPGQMSPAENQPPPTNKFTAPTRIGATPVYGSPNGFGAGNTGFDSLNLPRSKRKKPAQTPAPGAVVPQQPETTFTPVPTFNPAAPPKPPPPPRLPLPEIYPKKAATRPGAALPPLSEDLPVNNPPPEVHPLPAANRPGAVLPVPPPEYYAYVAPTYPAATPPPTLQPPNTFALGQLPQRPLPILAEPDPYAALGIRTGSFLLLPSLDLSSAYSTNPERVPGGPPAPYMVAAPELKVQSDWERHSLTADFAGSYTQYFSDLVPSLNVPYMNSKVDGRVDVTRDTQLILQLRGIINTDNPGSPNNTANLAKLPLNFDVGETVGVSQNFNRLTTTFKGTFDRATYDNSVLTNGTTTSNGDRNFDQYAGIGRFSYELDPGLKPFVEFEGDQRIHDEQFDRNGLQRDSLGVTGKFGTAVNLFGSLTGEMAIGAVDRVYRDPTLPKVAGVIGDGALIWQPTALTTAKLSATSQVYETVVNNASGELSRDLTLEVDHAFRYWLIGILKTGYGNDVYPGAGLQDNRWFASIGATYKLTRELQLNGTIRQDWQIATQPGFVFNATSFLLRLRVQR